MNEELKSKRVPVLAVVGRPNVGKSTLFNRLVGERRALVDDLPGVTRDRNYARVEYLGRVWDLIDTGGFEPSTGEDILRAMRTQTELAIQEADAIIFLLDGKEGLNPSDEEVTLILRKQKKPVFFAVNKIDGPRHEDKVLDFHALGVDEFYSISAEHGYGVAELLDGVSEVLPGLPVDEVEDEDQGPPRVAVVGRPNAGKSTLINSLLGEDRLLVHDSPGTTRDAVDSIVHIGGRTYLFVDTAGMRKKSRIDTRVERFSVMRSLRSLERCHLAVLMIDALEGVVDQDAKIAGLAHDRGRALIIVINKWDVVEDKEKRRAELDEQITDRLPHADYAPVLTISAKDGLRVTKLGALVDEVMEEYSKKIGTGELNRALEQWTGKNPPPSPKGRPIKLYYMTQTRNRPPTFIVFANRPDKVPETYRRYLVNQMRKTFTFMGSPIVIRYRSRSGKDQP